MDEIRLIKELWKIIEQNFDSPDDGSRLWELEQVKNNIINYPIVDPTIKGRRWNKEYTKYIDNVWEMQTYYKVVSPSEYVKTNDVDLTLALKDDIEAYLEMLGVKSVHIDGVKDAYSVDFNIFPKDQVHNLWNASDKKEFLINLALEMHKNVVLDGDVDIINMQTRLLNGIHPCMLEFLIAYKKDPSTKAWYDGDHISMNGEGIELKHWGFNHLKNSFEDLNDLELRILKSYVDS